MPKISTPCHLYLKKFFWDRVNKSGPLHPMLGYCWLWTGGKNDRGYGVMPRKKGSKSSQRSHRFAYELLVGKLDDELVLDHLCRNPSCVNPGHLGQVTNRENILRGKAPSANQARRTHCVRGHLLLGENLVLYYGSVRQCKICKDIRNGWRGMNRRKKVCIKCGKLKEGGVRGLRLCNSCRGVVNG